MACYHVSRETFLLARGLRDRGIPVDDYEFGRMEAACLGLRIEEQSGLQSKAFNLAGGGAGYVLEVVIQNESKRPLAPVHISFEGPDWERRMSLLPDPHKEYPARPRKNRRRLRNYLGAPIDYSVVRNTYFFPPDRRAGKAREEVLNHKVDRGLLVYPGEFLEGLLLVVGEQPIPSEFRDGDRIKIRLTVFDQRGRSHRAAFQPLVERPREERRWLAEISSGGETWVQDRLATVSARLPDGKAFNAGQGNQ